jgi:hypothetical protein
MHSCLQAGVALEDLKEHFPTAVSDACDIDREKLFAALSDFKGLSSAMDSMLDD